MSMWDGNALPAADGQALREQYWLTRFAFFRFLGLIYTVAFFILCKQLGPLIGSGGLLPARQYLERVQSAYGDRLAAFLAVPTLFWLSCSDAMLYVLAYASLGLSMIVLLGFAN